MPAFVVPTGYSFNLDGAAIYLSIALLFLTQAFGMPLTLEQQVAALGVLLLTSKGMAGVPGSSFLALSATATSLGPSRRRRRVAPRRGPHHGLDAGEREPARQLRRCTRRGQVAGRTRPRPGRRNPATAPSIADASVLAEPAPSVQ
ncbi:cation:dicarboxylase symporter family transporter [Sphingomonas sp. LR61]